MNLGLLATNEKYLIQVNNPEAIKALPPIKQSQSSDAMVLCLWHTVLLLSSPPKAIIVKPLWIFNNPRIVTLNRCVLKLWRKGYHMVSR